MLRSKNLEWKTTPLSLVLKLESVCDKKGNVMHCVTATTGQKENRHFYFQKFASALDFIWTNFE